MAAFILGGLFGSSYAISEGFGFVGGFLFFPIFLYLFFWFLPGLIPGKVLISLLQGEGGYLRTKKGDIAFQHIKQINLARNPVNLVNRIVIKTFDEIVYEIPAYDLIDETDFAVIVDKYIFSHMCSETQLAWNRNVNLDKLFREVNYERKADVKD
ncbi:YfjD family protein [Bacillus sp. F19]|nr:YfjD family protein [Bacillus sp. F19]